MNRSGGTPSFILSIVLGAFVAMLALAQPAEGADPAEAIDLTSGPAVEEITAEALYEALRAMKPVIVVVDARGPEAYAQGHIPGAVNIPVDRVEALGSALPKDAEVVVYCGGPECPHSAIVARWLVERGWKRVRHYREGILGWQQAGHALGAGPGPLSHVMGRERAENG